MVCVSNERLKGDDLEGIDTKVGSAIQWLTVERGARLADPAVELIVDPKADSGTTPDRYRPPLDVHEEIVPSGHPLEQPWVRGHPEEESLSSSDVLPGRQAQVCRDECAKDVPWATGLDDQEQGLLALALGEQRGQVESVA